MRKFAALLAIMTATALVSPMALAKGAPVPKVHAPSAGIKHAGKSAKRVAPPRGPNGRFLPRAKTAQ